MAKHDSFAGDTFTVVPNPVFLDERISAHGLLVYAALRFHMNNQTGECHPGWARIAKMARCKRTKVAEAIAELEQCGYLHRESRPGHSNVYTLVPVRSADYTRPRDGRVPVRSADPELYSEELDSGTRKPSPPVPAVLHQRAIKRGPVWKELADLTVERGGSWAAGAKEAKCMDQIVAWAKRNHNGTAEKFLRDFMDGAWALHQGKVLGLKQRDVEFWQQQPYTPSRLLSNAAAICSILERRDTAVRPGSSAPKKLTVKRCPNGHPYAVEDGLGCLVCGWKEGDPNDKP